MIGPQPPANNLLASQIFGADIPPEFQGLFADAMTQHQDAKKRADDLWSQLSQSIQQPAQQVAPDRAFIGRLLGGISQALAPNMGGQALAESGIADQNNELRTRKAQTLAALHDRYAEAAKAAEDAGDTEKAIKMRSAELKISKEREALAQQNRLDELKLRGQQDMAVTKQQGANALQVAQVGADKAIEVEKMKQTTSLYSSGFLAPGVPIPPKGLSATAFIAELRRIDELQRKTKDADPVDAQVATNARRAVYPIRLDTESVTASGALSYAQRQRNATESVKPWMRKAERQRLFTDEEVMSNLLAQFYGGDPAAAPANDFATAARKSGITVKDTYDFMYNNGINIPDWLAKARGAK